MKRKRDIGAERRWVHARLFYVRGLLAAAQNVDPLQRSTPQTRRAQTLKIKVAARALHSLHVALLLGKGRK